MKKIFLFGFALLMVFDTMAQLCFKLAAIHAAPLEFNGTWLARIFLNPWVYGAIIGYIGTFISWVALLKKLPIGTSFAISHLEVISVMLVSFWFFHEPITLVKLLGSSLIIIGVIFLAMDEAKSDSKTIKDTLP